MKKLLFILLFIPTLVFSQGFPATSFPPAGLKSNYSGTPGFVVSNVIQLIDPDVVTWATAAGITNGAVILAYSNLVTAWKAAGYWTNTKWIHPYTTDLSSGDPARFNQMKYNLKDPRDLDAAFRLTANGSGSTFTMSGFTNGGSGNWLTTHGTPAAVFSGPNAITLILGISVNLNQFSNDFGSTDFSGTNRNLVFNVVSNTAEATVSTASSIGSDMSSVSTSKAIWCIWRTGSATSGIYSNNSGTPFNTSAVASVALGATQEIFVGAISNGGSGVTPSTRTYVIDIAYNGTITGSDWVTMSTLINQCEKDVETALGLSTGTRSWF